MDWRVCGFVRALMPFALGLGGFAMVVLPMTPAVAGKNDARDTRQMLREMRRIQLEQRRLERLRRDDDDDRPVAKITPAPVAPAAPAAPAAAPAGNTTGPAAKAQASQSGGDKPQGGRNKSRGDDIPDEDGDGAPDTLADLVRVMIPKPPAPAPVPSSANASLPKAPTAPPATVRNLLERRESPRAVPIAPAITGTPQPGAPPKAAPVAATPAPLVPVPGKAPQAASSAAPRPAPAVTPQGAGPAGPDKTAAAPSPASPAAVGSPASAPVASPASAPALAPSAQTKAWSGRVVPAGFKAGSDLTLPDLPARRGELLAVNLTPQVADRARSLGYLVQPPETLSSLGMQLSRVILPPGANPHDALATLKMETGGTGLAVNSVYRSIRSANDDPQAENKATQQQTPPASSGGCTSARCYGMQAINWSPSLATCARQVRVGVIDTGIDVGHPAFKRRIHVADVHQGTQRIANSAHGTGVLALLAGDPASSTPGLIPDAEFFAVNIFYADKTGAPISDTAHLLRALDMLDALEVRVINLSLTGPKDDLVEAAVSKLARNGTILVAAAGNEGPGAPPAYPAAYKDVIAVTAVNRDKRAYRNANHGDYIDVAAPGVDIWTALPNRGQGPLSGTSLATPFVSAVIAGLYPGLPQKSKSAALARLEFTDLGSPGRDPVYGNGLVVSPKTCQPNAPTVASTPPPSSATGSSSRPWDLGTVVTRPAAGNAGFGFQ